MEPIQWFCGTQPAEVRRAISSVLPGAWLLGSLAPGRARAREPAGPDLAAFAAASGATLVVLDPRLTMLDPEVLLGLLHEALAHADLLTLLVPPGKPPPVTSENHGTVRAFVGPAALLQALPVAPAE